VGEEKLGMMVVIAEEAMAVVSRLTLWLVEQGQLCGNRHVRYVLA
jgi:hypothetical protein